MRKTEYDLAAKILQITTTQLHTKLEGMTPLEAKHEELRRKGYRAITTAEVYWVNKNGKSVLKRAKNGEYRELSITPQWNEYKYLRVSIRGKNEYLHRLVYQTHDHKVPKGMTVDHIDGDKLNNDISNLRILTRAENSRQGQIRTWKNRKQN